MSLPDGLDVHRLRVPQPLPGGYGGGRVTSDGWAVSDEGYVHKVLVVWRRVAVVENESRVRRRRVNALHGGVHLVDELLQIHVVLW